MLSFKDLTKYFGSSLSDTAFQAFLSSNFDDLTQYNVVESNYISSAQAKIELGFQNKEAVIDDDDEIVFNEGNPLFSTFNIFPGSTIKELPFNLIFADKRNEVLAKAGEPTQTRKGEASFLGPAYLVDNFKVGETVVSVDYNPESQAVNFIQIRDNNLVEHLRL
jgi:hypothetical protein